MKIFNNIQSKAFAREIVKHRLPKNLDGEGISAKSKRFVHIVATNTHPLTLDVVRQAILLCHFPNFHDDMPDMRTRITILAPLADEQRLHELEQQLSSPEYLGNLLPYCTHTLHMEGVQDISQYKVENSFIDVEVEIIGLAQNNADDFMKNFTPDRNAIVTIFANHDDLNANTQKHLAERFHQLYLLPEQIEEGHEMIPGDVLPQAKLANLIYYAGKYNKDIYIKDINNAAAYTPAMRTFLFHTPQAKATAEWNALDDDALKLSNLYCVDAFEYRLRSVGCSTDTPAQDMQKAVNQNISDLSRTEHARWNVEKLILGFRPFSDEERYRDEMTFGAAQEAVRNKLKKEQHVHIDLCSYNTLRRISPEAMKYDVFLMLAMPEILNRHKNGRFSRFLTLLKRPPLGKY